MANASWKKTEGETVIKEPVGARPGPAQPGRLLGVSPCFFILFLRQATGGGGDGVWMGTSAAAHRF